MMREIERRVRTASCRAFTLFLFSSQIIFIYNILYFFSSFSFLLSSHAIQIFTERGEITACMRRVIYIWRDILKDIGGSREYKRTLFTPAGEFYFSVIFASNSTELSRRYDFIYSESDDEIYFSPMHEESFFHLEKSERKRNIFSDECLSILQLFFSHYVLFLLQTET